MCPVFQLDMAARRIRSDGGFVRNNQRHVLNHVNVPVLADGGAVLRPRQNYRTRSTELARGGRSLRSRWSANYSASARWTNETAIDPSPTADATRLTLPHRTSPTANTPGSEVSSRYGARASGHRAAARSSCVR